MFEKKLVSLWENGETDLLSEFICLVMDDSDATEADMKLALLFKSRLSQGELSPVYHALSKDLKDAAALEYLDRKGGVLAGIARKIRRFNG